jgi:putative Mg2+ transporter-C (MgtC) family protein
MTLAALIEPFGEGADQITELVIALVLCSLIGMEREFKQKSAGLRTHTLVGLASALFVLFSKYGFTDVLGPAVVLDPSRVAAQIVSGIGFIGGGLIFVRRDIVRGLTTAAVVWVSAAVGCASAAGLPILAAVTTAAHFLVVYGYPPLVRLATRSQPRTATVQLSYVDGRGVLRRVLQVATESGYTVAAVHTERRPAEAELGPKGKADAEQPAGGLEGVPLVELRLRLTGPRSVTELTSTLADLDGVQSVDIGDVDDTSE